MGEWLLPNAIAEVTQQLALVETEWDPEKLQNKLTEYFKKAAKNCNFKGRQGLDVLINEFADNALGSIFAGLGDREWLYTGQADFVLVLDAAIKDNFPAWMLKNIEQSEFEQLVLAAYDRAFEEQRFGPILSEIVPQIVSGPKTKKKVWNCADEGRKVAFQSGTISIEEFTTIWINSAIENLSIASQGAPEGTMEPELAVQMFVSLLEGGALPLSMMADGTAPPVHIVQETVANAYSQFTQGEEEWQQPAAKKRKAAYGSFSAW